MNEQLNEQDTQMLKIAMKQALEFVLDSGEKLVQQAEQIGPEKAAISTIVPLMRSIYASAKESGAELRMEILMAAGVHVIRAIAELFIMAGVLKESDAKQFAQTVTKQSIAQHNGGA